MSRLLRTVAVVTAVFLATSAATIVITAQLDPGWQQGRALEQLHPDHPVEAPATPDLEVIHTEVAVPLPGGDTSAVLVSPAGPEPATTGVVLVGGSGPSTRRQLLPLADELAARGVAALTYDKGAGDYSLTHRDYDQLGTDALASVTTLRQKTGIDRIGLLGISEGGWVVTAAAAEPGTPIDFAVLISAPVVTPMEQISWTVDRRIPDAPPSLRRIPASVLAAGRTIIDYLDFHSTPRLKNIQVPVHAIWGATDSTVPINAAYRRLSSTLETPLTATIVADMGHNLMPGTSRWAPALTAWMNTPTARALTGVEPDSALGVAVPPRSIWFADPRLHLALTTATTLTAGLLSWRHQSPRTTR
ncbi:alpha/beta hydrolase family protein [Kocuria arenosa]|uniref:alpha/beta hydrolase family protein n=1 Tax=Kocuria arenosa TaxID=3071446 RepID=UPI0034D6D49B